MTQPSHNGSFRNRVMWSLKRQEKFVTFFRQTEPLGGFYVSFQTITWAECNILQETWKSCFRQGHAWGPQTYVV